MTLRDLQAAAGATFANTDIPQTFPDDRAALAAASRDPDGVALYDRSHWGRLQLTGEDRQRFLHNQTTNDLQRRSAGECCETTFVNSTARTIDLATAICTSGATIAIVSPERRAVLLPMLDRYIFPMDRVELTDITDATVCFSAIGAGGAALCDRLGVVHPDAGRHIETEIAGVTVRLAATRGLSRPELTLIADCEAGAALWQTIVEAGAQPLGEATWDELRAIEGRPRADRELTENYNPLEAGLWHTVSFDKGCYIGQETIARLNTYKGVKQQLWGLRAEGANDLPVGATLMLDDVKVGVVTSAIATEDGAIGLGYVRTKAGGADLVLAAGDVCVRTVEIPHATRGYLAEVTAG